MISIDTEPGSEYSVRSSAGCTVSTPAGQVICRVMPGILGSFCASTYVTCLSDAAATVTLVSSGAPGGTGGNALTISQALDAANRAESAADRAEAGASAAELQAQGATVANSAAQAALAGAQAAENNAESSALASATCESNATAAAERAATSEENAAEAASAAAAAAAESEESALRTRAAAWPAVMVLLRDELMQLVGEGRFDLDRDGEKIVVHTDRLGDPELAAVNEMLARFVPSFLELVQYNHHIEVSWRDINRFFGCVTDADIAARCPGGDAGNLLTSDGWWIYRMPDYHKEPSMFMDKHPLFRTNVTHIVTDGKLVADYGGYWVNNYTMFGWCPKLVFVEMLNKPADDMIRWFCGCKKLSHVRIDFSGIRGSIRMMFDLCVLDRDSVLHILEGLPLNPKEKETTLGIHIDHQNDEEVLAAIANAEAKGWTLEVQWNGTPTSTASVMRFGQLIYAKVGEMEHPDGTTERVLDWGHYVTDEEGYETFRSLESAYEYFGLPMPEVDLAATE